MAPRACADLGHNDVGWHNGQALTPTLDRLVKAGVEMPSFYVRLPALRSDVWCPEAGGPATFFSCQPPRAFGAGRFIRCARRRAPPFYPGAIPGTWDITTTTVRVCVERVASRRHPARASVLFCETSLNFWASLLFHAVHVLR